MLNLGRLSALAIGVVISTSTGFRPVLAQERAESGPDSAKPRLVPLTVGFGAKSREVGFTVWTLDSSTFGTVAHPRTLSELLRARVPGLSVLSRSGDPEEGSNVRLRGAQTLLADQELVVIVDGIPVQAPQSWSLAANIATSRLDDFDPEDVVRIDVLPGAAATALYGTGHGGGAIVITTKQGRAGPPQWRAWSEAGQSADLSDYPDNYRQSGTNPSTGTAASRCGAPEVASNQCVPTSLGVWNPIERASPFRGGQRRAGGVSISGGPNGWRGYFSSSLNSESGVLAEDDASSLKTRVNVERDFGRFSIQGNAAFVDRAATLRNDLPIMRGVMGLAVDDANHGYLPVPPFMPTERDGRRVTRGLRAQWRARPWINVFGVAGRDEVWQHDITRMLATAFGPERLFDVRDSRGSSVGHLGAEASYQFRVPLRTLLVYQESHRSADPNRALWSSARGVMLQQRISVRDALFVNVGTRWQAQRGAGEDRFQPSVDASWIAPKFAREVEVRLRGAYAEAIGPQYRLPQYETFTCSAAGCTVTPAGFTLAPERPSELEIGLDIRLGTRMNVEVTQFSHRTANLHLVYQTPTSLGFGPYMSADALMRNRGFEGSARVLVLDHPHAALRMSATMATARNRLSALQPHLSYIEGQPSSVYASFPYDWVDADGDKLPDVNEVTPRAREPRGTRVPTREATLRSELSLPRARLSFGVALDHRGGHRAENLDSYRCWSNGTCRSLQDPAAVAEAKARAVAKIFHGAKYVFLEDASYSRLAEVAMRWRTPDWRWLASGATVSLEGRNLAMRTRFAEFDPEVATANATENPLLRTTLNLPRVVSLRIDVGR